MQKKLSDKYLTSKEIQRFFDGGSDDCELNVSLLNSNDIVDLIPYDKTLEVPSDTFEHCKPRNHNL